jgi:hypothetical protein
MVIIIKMMIPKTQIQAGINEKAYELHEFSRMILDTIAILL